MALRRWTGSAWTDVQQVRRWTGSQWVKVPLKRWSGSQWINTIQYIYTNQFAMTDHQTFWNNGTRDNQFPNEHFQGVWNGNTGDLRHDLIIFNYTDIASILQNSNIQQVRVRLQRLSTVHGSSGEATVVINSHNIDSVPSTWNGSGLTQQAVEGFTRGQEKWVVLPNAVGEGLRDGTIKGLAISTTNTSISYYARMDTGRTLLEITYEQ